MQRRAGEREAARSAADRRADAHPEASELVAAEDALGVGAGEGEPGRVCGGANRPGVFLLVNGLFG